MKHWLDPTPVTVPPELAAAVGTTLGGAHPLVAETLARRGITDPEVARRFLNADLYTPASPFDLPDMEVAVERIERAINSHEKIAVWGDFDVDGQTATSLLVSALRHLGADVTYHIPNRLTQGHGIHIARLGQLIDEGAGLIVTCDTGIAAHEAVDFARSRGVDTVITDHHLLTPTLPAAYAVVNPQRLPEAHPLRTLPGVGVAYKLVEALYSKAGRGDATAQFLDLVALGIVADVAEQTGDTRYLLQRGLDALRHTQRLGLQILMQLADLKPEELNEGHIGFALGPRLNALGRLDDANAAVELLTTADLERARILANRLEGLNNERRLLSEQVYQAAISQIDRDPSLLDFSALVLAHEHWPGGIIGIVASRLVERHNRPVILLSAPPNDLARGSARSVPGVDITAALAAVASHSDLLTGFGGHTMAAGLSLPAARIPELRRALSRTVKAMLKDVDTTPTLRIDGYLSLADLTPDLVASLEKLAPFGAGNPPLTLATRTVTLKSQRGIGRTGDHQRLTIEDEAGSVQNVLWWQAELETLPPGRFDLAYTVRANDYQGRREVQLEFIDTRPVDEEPQQFSHRAAVKVIDYRSEESPEELLHIYLGDNLSTVVGIRPSFGGSPALSSQSNSAAIWCEGPTPIENGQPRDKLTPASMLIIWTAPPGPTELRAALEAVNPATVMLFGLDPRADSMQGFLQRLAGAVKHVLNQRDGQANLTALAGVLAQRETTIMAGLAWMQARGHIHIVSNDDSTLRLTEAQAAKATQSEQTETTARLATLLKETAAYRAYFRRADKDALITTYN